MTWIRIVIAVLVLSSVASADCIIEQNEKIGIPMLPDFKGTVTTYCSDGNIILVDYEQDNNFFVGMFASQLPKMPDLLFDLPHRRRWSMYQDDETFVLKRLRRYTPMLTSKTVAECDSIRREAGIDFVWETSAIGRSKDTIADIPCDRIFFSGVGVSQGETKAKCRINVDIRTAEVCADNEPINRIYTRYVDTLGFDPLKHYVMGLAIAVAFNAPVRQVEDALKSMEGFPIQIDLKMELSDWNVFNGTFTYHLTLDEIVEKPIPQEKLSVPKYYRTKNSSGAVAGKH